MVTDRAWMLANKAKKAAMSNSADACRLSHELMDEVDGYCLVNEKEFGELFSGVVADARLIWRFVELIPAWIRRIGDEE